MQPFSNDLEVEYQGNRPINITSSVNETGLCPIRVIPDKDSAEWVIQKRKIYRDLRSTIQDSFPSAKADESPQWEEVARFSAK